ncbi:MAG: hypothetical protein WA485_04385 [Candidatus Sulfotelmatobacter sp.]
MGQPNQHLTVLVRPRQTRVAYLIDPAATSLDLLDTLFSASTGFWGGRLFPIIPVIDGLISPGYWSLLRRIDPDWVYSYTVLPQDTVDQLLREINPLAMERHANHLLRGDAPHYFPSLDHRLVRVQRMLGYATETRWFRKPSLVTYKTKQGKTDTLIARNFGILRRRVAQPFEPPNSPKCGCPVLAFFCKGGYSGRRKRVGYRRLRATRSHPGKLSTAFYSAV